MQIAARSSQYISGRMLCLLLSCLVWAVPSPVMADAFSINVVSVTNSLYLSAKQVRDVGGVTTSTDTTKSLESSNGIAGTLDGTMLALPIERPELLNEVWASGTADMLALSSYTFAQEQYGSAKTIAESVVDFAPVADGTATIGLSAVLGGPLSAYSDGSVMLEDLTTGLMLWNYYWDCCFLNGNMPWVGFTATLLLQQAFDSDHLYRFTTQLSTNSASGDVQRATLNVSGVQAVPEPASLTLLVTAIAVFGGVQLRQRCSPPTRTV